ncbi:MAG: TolC family protein [Porticoccaceae bacterium]
MRGRCRASGGDGRRRLLALWLLLGVAALRGEELATLSLPEAIELALVNNPEFLNSLDYAEMADIDYENARAIYRTKFQSSTASDARSGADVGSTYSLAASKRYPSGSGVSAGLYNYNFADRNLSEFRLSYTLPIFRDPLKDGRFDVDQKRMTRDRQQLLAAIGQQELINRVVAAYYQLALANEGQRLAGLQEDIARRIHQAAVIRHGADSLSALDLAGYELRLARARHGRDQALFNRARAEQQLKILTGLDLAAPLAIGPASLSTIDMKLLALPVADLETLALDRRAEAVGARDELRLARERVVAAGGQGLTGIDISLQYAWVRESDSFSDSLELDDHRFGVGFNMDTDFGFGDQQRRKRLLVLQYQTKKRDHERLVGDIRLQVRQAYFDVQRLQGQMDIAARALAIAEQEFSRARIRHDNGLVDPIALLEAEYQLEDARYQAYSARVGYLMAGQGLVMASGYFDIH